MARRKADERTYKYKLKVYQRNLPDYVCGILISIKTLGQYEENEARPNGITQKEKVQTKEPQIIKGRGHEDKEPHMNWDQE